MSVISLREVSHAHSFVRVDRLMLLLTGDARTITEIEGIPDHGPVCDGK